MRVPDMYRITILPVKGLVLKPLSLSSPPPSTAWKQASDRHSMGLSMPINSHVRTFHRVQAAPQRNATTPA